MSFLLFLTFSVGVLGDSYKCKIYLFASLIINNQRIEVTGAEFLLDQNNGYIHK